MELITGLHAIEEAIKRGQGKMKVLAEKETKRISMIKKMANNKEVAFELVQKGKIDSLCGSQEHKGVVLLLEETAAENPVVSLDQVLSNSSKKEGSLILILDGITDPHNLGAIIRSADQFAISAVLIPERRSVKITETVRRVSSGATSWIPVVMVTNLNRSLEQLKEEGYWIYGADMGGTDIGLEKFPSKTCLVMGSEGSGLSTLLGKNCDQIVSIPTKGHVDSFNVSVAAGIMMYEIRRQQGLFIQA